MTLVALFTIARAEAQIDIFQLMERNDLPIQEVEKIADSYFKEVGTGKGTGYKQYQRWLYERKFHLDENGYQIPAEKEDMLYNLALRKMPVASRGAYEWKELGPHYWNATSSWNPGVGRLTSVAVNPNDTNVIFVSSPGGGIWRSTNGGASWSPLIDFINSSWQNVFHICIDSSNSKVVYAALSNGGVIKSTDGGNTWAATGSGPSNSRQVKIFPGKSNLIFAAATNGLWRSVNAGVNWVKVENATKEDIEFCPSNPSIMYAAGNGGSSYVWRSQDSGKTWSGIDSAKGMMKKGRTLLAVCAADPSIVYVAQASGSAFGAFYKSNDYGSTFTVQVLGSPSNGTNYFGYSPDGTGTGGQASYDMAIVANPFDAAEVYIAGIIVWRTLDSGLSFEAITVWSYPNGTGYNHADVHGLEWVGHTLYSNSDGGIYKSLDRGEEWMDLTPGLGIRQFYRIDCSVTDPNMITGGSQDNGNSIRTPSKDWIDWLGADGMDNAISKTDANVAFGLIQNGGLYRTDDGGMSQQGLTKPSNGNWITPFLVHPTNHDTLYGGWTGIYRSDDRGASWNLIGGGSQTIDQLAVAPSNPRYVYASKGSNLMVTKDGGQNWVNVSVASTINSIFVSKYNPEKIWLGINNSAIRVIVSENAGGNFTDISAGLPALVARDVVVDEDANETIYAGMNLGVYYRDSITNTWAVAATGLPLVAINDLEIQKSGAKLRVATYGRGVWECNLRNVALPCSAPAAVNTVSVISNSAIIAWDAVENASSYTIEFKKILESFWTTHDANNTGLTDTLTGLTADMDYNWRVRANCDSDSSSFASGDFKTTSSAGIRNTSNLRTSVYPDPATDVLFVKFNASSMQRVEMRLVTATGAAVFGSRYEATNGENIAKLNIETLSNGAYVLQLLTKEGWSYTQFIIQR